MMAIMPFPCLVTSFFLYVFSPLYRHKFRFDQSMKINYSSILAESVKRRNHSLIFFFFQVRKHKNLHPHLDFVFEQ